MIERWGILFTCNHRDFPEKFIHAPDFLHLPVVHLLDHINQDFPVADAHTLIVGTVIERNTAVESGAFFIDLFFSANSVLL